MSSTGPATTVTGPATTATGPATTATGPATTATGPGANWRWGRFYAAAWLVVLLPLLREALGQPDRLRGAAGVVALAAFCVLYVVTWSLARSARIAGTPLPARVRRAVVGGAVCLATVECVLVGEEALSMATFLIVLVMFLLGPRVQLVATAAIIAATALAIELVPGWRHDLRGLAAPVVTAFIIWSIVQIMNRNAQLARAQDRIAQLAVLEERARFARDLHDLLGHSLTLLAMKAELAGRLVRLDPDRAEHEIAEVERLARDALGDVRAAVGGYRQVGLAGELASARAALDAAGIAAELPTALDEVPGERRELLGWAVREGVTNVVRHSRARRCRIVVAADGVEIVDDGRGAPATGQDTVGSLGSGLRGLRERAEAAGATVVVGDAPGGGFRLRVGW